MRQKTILILTLVGLISACSSKWMPGKGEPVCGPSIDNTAVKLVDASHLWPNQSAVEQAIQRQAGPHRIMTPEPVWVPRRSTTGDHEQPGSIAGAIAVAADWGCDLVVILDTRMARNDITVQARNEERIFLVHAGTR